MQKHGNGQLNSPTVSKMIMQIIAILKLENYTNIISKDCPSLILLAKDTKLKFWFLHLIIQDINPTQIFLLKKANFLDVNLPMVLLILSKGDNMLHESQFSG